MQVPVWAGLLLDEVIIRCTRFSWLTNVLKSNVACVTAWTSMRTNKNYIGSDRMFICTIYKPIDTGPHFKIFIINIYRREYEKMSMTDHKHLEYILNTNCMTPNFRFTENVPWSLKYREIKYCVNFSLFFHYKSKMTVKLDIRSIHFFNLSKFLGWLMIVPSLKKMCNYFQMFSP